MEHAIHSPVLIVEDDARLRAVLERGLRGYGFPVHTAGTAAAACEILSAEPIAAIVVDFGLPDKNGWEVIRRSRSAPGVAPKSILITAMYRPQAPDPEASPDVILNKPFGIEDLIYHLLHPGASAATGISKAERHMA